jgi:hypothetical protein
VRVKGGVVAVGGLNVFVAKGVSIGGRGVFDGGIGVCVAGRFVVVGVVVNALAGVQLVSKDKTVNEASSSVFGDMFDSLYGFQQRD